VAVIQFCIKRKSGHSLESLFEAGLDLQIIFNNGFLPQHKEQSFPISPEATSITETQDAPTASPTLAISLPLGFVEQYSYRGERDDILYDLGSGEDGSGCPAVSTDSGASVSILIRASGKPARAAQIAG